MKLYQSKKTIYGCEKHNGGKTPYLTRYVIRDFGRFGQFCLHYFHRSDEGTDCHCHPWHFISLIVWGGYYEHTLDGMRRRKYPGMLLFRRATWAHRAELVGRCSISLIWKSDYVREWGFYTPSGWVHWRSFFQKKGCD